MYAGVPYIPIGSNSCRTSRKCNPSHAGIWHRIFKHTHVEIMKHGGSLSECAPGFCAPLWLLPCFNAALIPLFRKGRFCSSERYHVYCRRLVSLVFDLSIANVGYRLSERSSLLLSSVLQSNFGRTSQSLVAIASNDVIGVIAISVACSKHHGLQHCIAYSR